MIRFFRQIRQRLLTDNKFSKYLLYAVGEILLVVIGILIALQVDNWNEDREKNEAFQLALSQVYTDLHKERSWYEFLIAGYKRASSLADQELRGGLVLQDAEIPKYVYYFNSLDLADFDLGNEPLLDNLQDNITSTSQRDLVNKISSHFSIWDSWNEVVNKSRITFMDSLISKYKVPFSERYTMLSFSVIHGGEKVFTDEEIEKARALRSDPAYKVALKSAVNRNLDLIGRFSIKLKTINEMIAIIEDHYPNIPMTLSNVVIYGSALKGHPESDVSLLPANERKTLWHRKIEMEKGTFRIRDGKYSIPSWGNSMDNDSTLLHNGFEIPILDGTYEITVDFSNMNYSIKQL